MASPFFSSNHLTTMETVGAKNAPVPNEATPQKMYKYKIELICEDRINPKPARSPPNITTFLGPYLSLRRPIIIPETLCDAAYNEKTDEVKALLHPNSSIKGLKKTP